MIRRAAWVGMMILATGVAAYAVAALVSTSMRTSFVQALFTNLPLATSAHLAGGTLALVFGGLQLSSTLRRKYLQLHRWLGRVYVVAVLASGTGGLVMALESTGGLVAHFGFGLMAVCWLFCTSNAFRHIRNGDVARHRAWMLRSYALTLAAVTLRIYLPASQIAGIDFIAAYQAIAWLCWVPNLLVVEWLVLARERAPAPPR